YLPPPWGSDDLELEDSHRHHLAKVLRLVDGSPISYTDGAGRSGEGVLAGGVVARGAEATRERPRPEVSVAVAPPRKPARLRFLVEKLAEIGIDTLYWLQTRHGEGRPPRTDKAASWAQAALEQSRGAWLMSIQGPVPVSGLPESSTLWVAERERQPLPSVVEGGTLVIGPEAGFLEGEIPVSANRVGLGARVLRIETAAVVGAAALLDRSGRLVPGERPSGGVPGV
ncbi:MAG: RsmE family RNA methyltransferase, partial [Acidimicrobiia bacterium]